jgi:multimeric flavodoxin WrbA
LLKILGICGSPKRGGNSEYLLEEALLVASERGFQTQRLLCSTAKIGYCNDCGECSSFRPCPIDDDMRGFYQAFEEADGIIVSSPVYFGVVTAQLKAVLDRTLPLRRQGFKLKDKAGCAIAVGRSRNGGQEKTIESIHSWMHIQGMIIVGDSSHFGGIAVEPAFEDKMGRESAIACANKLCDLLERSHRPGSCWGGD